MQPVKSVQKRCASGRCNWVCRTPLCGSSLNKKWYPLLRRRARLRLRAGRSGRMLRGSGAALVQRNQHLFFAVNKGRGVVAGELETMTVRNRVGGAGLYAVAAKDTAVVVDVIDIRIPLAAAEAGFRSILGSLDVDAIGRAG